MPPNLPLEILLMIARLLTDGEGKLRFGDFNSYLQVNRVLYRSLNRTLWREAAADDTITPHVFAHLIRSNDAARLKFFLELGAEVETILQDYERSDASDRWGSGNTVLKVAAQLDIVPMARLLLEHGADLIQYDQLERPSYSAIHAARSAEMVRLLLDHHADPEQQVGNGLRPLHFYAERGNTEAMRAVLRIGVEVDQSGGIFTPTPLPTPLHYAVLRNRVGAVKLLLEHGADAKKKKGFVEDMPLHLAVKAGGTEVATLLLERWPEGIREKNGDGYTPLHSAAKAGGTEVATLLLERWPEGIREKNGDGYTPLHFAAQAGKADLVKLFLERWPEAAKEKDKDGNTPLHLAARYIGWNTPLHLAARCWNIDSIRLLVESWSEGKDALNEDGKTPWLALGRLTEPKLDQWEEVIALLGGVRVH